MANDKNNSLLALLQRRAAGQINPESFKKAASTKIPDILETRRIKDVQEGLIKGFESATYCSTMTERPSLTTPRPTEDWVRDYEDREAQKTYAGTYNSPDFD